MGRGGVGRGDVGWEGGGLVAFSEDECQSVSSVSVQIVSLDGGVRSIGSRRMVETIKNV